jgi:hypothetical protein
MAGHEALAHNAEISNAGMVTRRISATELARKLGDVLGRVRYRGESFIVERNGAPVDFGVLVGPRDEAHFRAVPGLRVEALPAA